MPALLILLSLVSGYTNHHCLKKKRNFSLMVKSLANAHDVKPYGYSQLEPGTVPFLTLASLVVWLDRNRNTNKTIIDYVEELENEQK